MLMTVELALAGDPGFASSVTSYTQATIRFPTFLF